MKGTATRAILFTEIWKHLLRTPVPDCGPERRRRSPCGIGTEHVACQVLPDPKGVDRAACSVFVDKISAGFPVTSAPGIVADRVCHAVQRTLLLRRF